MAAEFGSHEIPDTVPDDFVAEYGETARNIVAASARRHPWRAAPWGAWVEDAAMAVALLGIAAALILLMFALPILGLPLAFVAMATTGGVVARWVTRRHRIRHRSRQAG